MPSPATACPQLIPAASCRPAQWPASRAGWQTGTQGPRRCRVRTRREAASKVVAATAAAAKAAATAATHQLTVGAALQRSRGRAQGAAWVCGEGGCSWSSCDKDGCLIHSLLPIMRQEMVVAEQAPQGPQR
jgi:hypothetical protein